MNPIIRSIARALMALVLVLMFISGLAQLSGCHVTRAFSDAEAASAPALQPVACRNWQDCA
jgi:hypothetical protein